MIMKFQLFSCLFSWFFVVSFVFFFAFCAHTCTRARRSETGRRGSKSKRKRGESSSSSAGGGGPGGNDTKRGRAEQRALNIDALQRTYAPRHVLTPLELRNVLAALASLIDRHGPSVCLFPPLNFSLPQRRKKKNKKKKKLAFFVFDLFVDFFLV